MPKLNREQPFTLLKILQFANRKAGVLPTAKQLSSELHISERTASARLKRLVEAQSGCFITDGRTRLINYEMLCTERESASLLLLIYEKCATSPNGRVLKSEVASGNFQSFEQADKFFQSVSNARYIQEIPANPNDIRSGAKLYDHLEYLKLLAGS